MPLETRITANGTHTYNEGPYKPVEIQVAVPAPESTPLSARLLVNGTYNYEDGPYNPVSIVVDVQPPVADEKYVAVEYFDGALWAVSKPFGTWIQSTTQYQALVYYGNILVLRGRNHVNMGGNYGYYYTFYCTTGTGSSSYGNAFIVDISPGDWSCSMSTTGYHDGNVAAFLATGGNTTAYIGYFASTDGIGRMQTTVFIFDYDIDAPWQ